MAGFFGLFDYTKPGKGVRKDEPRKHPFIRFFELYFRKFWRLIQLNLLYLLFCIPVVTIGAATAGFTYVMRNMVNEQPVFMFSDFWDAFKLNWKQSTVYYLLMAVMAFILSVAANFYFANAQQYNWMYIPAVLTLFISLMLLLMSFYVMLMIVTLDLPLKAIFKNALILAIVCLKNNLITLLCIGLLVAACLFFVPVPILFLLILLLLPSLFGFIICYNSYPGIQKYAIDPYLEQQGSAEEERDEDETLFTDEMASPDK